MNTYKLVYEFTNGNASFTFTASNDFMAKFIAHNVYGVFNGVGETTTLYVVTETDTEVTL